MGQDSLVTRHHFASGIDHLSIIYPRPSTLGPSHIAPQVFFNGHPHPNAHTDAFHNYVRASGTARAAVRRHRYVGHSSLQTSSRRLIITLTAHTFFAICFSRYQLQGYLEVWSELHLGYVTYSLMISWKHL